MSAVKTFFSHSHSSLNDEVQEWLGQTETTVLAISMDSNEYGHCLVVLHEPGAGHRYEARVVFANRHTDLETEVNRELGQARQGGCQLVAVGSNQYGHCLCVIQEV